MRYPVEQCGCHLGIAKDRHPLSELQIGCNDDACLLVKLADEMEQQRPAGFRERDVPQLINDHAIHLGKLPDDFASISLGLFFNQGIDEIDSIVEAGLFSLIDKRRPQGDSNMGLPVPAPPTGIRLWASFVNWPVQSCSIPGFFTADIP